MFKKLISLNNNQLDIWNNSIVGYNNNKQKIFKPDDNLTAGSSNWYLYQFFEQTIHSEIELVYETFQIEHVGIQNKKSKTDICGYPTFNEKTIKLLVLGKPFIHIDPLSLKMMEMLGFENYKVLMTDKVQSWIDKDEYDIKEYINDVFENVQWLLDMDEIEYKERITEAYTIAKRNKDKTDDILYNTSLLPFIKSLF